MLSPYYLIKIGLELLSGIIYNGALCHTSNSNRKTTFENKKSSCFPSLILRAKKEKKKVNFFLFFFFFYCLFLFFFSRSCFLLKYLYLQKCKISGVRSVYVGQKHRKTTVL